MTTPIRVLMVEDSEDDALLVIRELRNGGFDPTYERVDTASAVRTALETQDWDIVISDYIIPGFSGLEALKLVRQSGKDIPFILISGRIGEDAAVEAMAKGADDYIVKDNLARLVPAVRRELREAAARHEHRQVEQERDRLLEQVESERERLQAVLQHMPAGVVIANIPSGNIEFANEQMQRIFRRPKDAFGTVYDMQNIGASHSSGRRYELADWPLVRSIREGEVILNEEISFYRPDGTYAYVLVSSAPIYDRQGRTIAVVGIFRDVTESKIAERSLREADRLLKMLIAIGDTFTNASSEEQLIGEICRFMVQHGKYRLVWIGYPEQDESKSIRPVAHAGYEDGYFDVLKASWSDSVPSHDPVSMAIRQRQVVVFEDMTNYPEAKNRGYASAISLPLVIPNQFIGALTVYSTSPSKFSDDERKVLMQIARNLAQKLTQMRLQDK